MKNYSYELEKDVLLMTEAEKLGDDYLRQEIDESINACKNGDLDQVRESYKVRSGERDMKDFEYLWQAYGIESAGTIRHIPVLRTLFDSLVGTFLEQPFNFQVTASDTESVNYMLERQRNEILRECERYYASQVKAANYAMAGQNKEAARKAEHFIGQLKNRYESGDFQSDLEIDAKNMLEWAIQRFKMQGLAGEMCDDMVTSGIALYQVKVEQIGQKPIVRILNPANVFFTKPDGIKWVKKCNRVVIREYLPVSEIWMRYGHKMTQKDQDNFMEKYNQHIIGSDVELIHYERGFLESGRRNEKTVSSLTVPLVEVNFVEWKTNIKIPYEGGEESVESKSQDRFDAKKVKYKYRLDRFSGIRIGEDVYVNAGRDKFVVRDPDDPSDCDLTVNGACFQDKNGKPYSLPLKTKDIADKIDILYYHAENLLAVSGVRAFTMDVADIPAWMGDTAQERIMKFLGYLKQGIALKDGSQETKSNNNTLMQSVDMSLSTAILTIYDMIERLEATAYKITGVARQSVGNVTQSDGKGTSEIAIAGSATVQKPLFFLINELVQEFVTDTINACRVAYRDGLQGALILGRGQRKIFSLKSDQFKLAHLNAWIDGTGDTERAIDAVRELAIKMADQGVVEADVAVDMATMKSLTEITKRVKDSIRDQKNNQMNDMQNQIEQLQQQAEQYGSQVQKFQAEDAQGRKIELEYQRQKDQRDLDLKSKKIDGDLVNNADKIRLDEKRVDLEALQIQYEPSAREVKNN